MSTTSIREARPADAGLVAGMIKLLAHGEDGESPVTAGYVGEYLAAANVAALLAERGGVVVGLLTYSLHPGLFHAGTWASIDEVIVRPEARGAGVGDALVAEAMCRFEALDCKEASVSTGLDNEPAKALYRKHGLTEEALLLEKHF